MKKVIENALLESMAVKIADSICKKDEKNCEILIKELNENFEFKRFEIIVFADRVKYLTNGK